MGILSEQPKLRTNGELLEFRATNFGTFAESHDIASRLIILVNCIKELHSFNEEIIRLKTEAIFQKYAPLDILMYPYAGHFRITISQATIKHTLAEVRIRPKTY